MNQISSGVSSKSSRFFEMKRRGEKIAMLTAYDYPTARAEAAAGVDVILVGDSVGTNILGYKSEQEVTLADIAHHVRAVRRGAPETVILADLPYRTYDTPEQAVASARMLREAGADLVKFEGPRPAIAAALVAAGIGVCGHLGLEPQHHLEKRLKGRSAQEAKSLLANARALDAAGISMLVLELIPEEVAATVTRAIKAPTIGIGAGRLTDGQVLVICDMLGFTPANFRHNRRYHNVGPLLDAATADYVKEVREGRFPAEANLFHMPEEELSIFTGDAA
ncbi:MAG: 3-methyl-2-oxobutanoate hydroxymethyltransferase [Beijerinckiaceae bacterium]|nr:MAG: 3-methyl-2-oxobutanoate hydroxymethyltransferase [Beijerinckiaceae bacterium]